MVVYWEYAFAENFILDGLLLYLALKCARARVRALNLLLAAALGAVEAIVFPLLRLPVWAAYIVKILGGGVLGAVAVSKGTKKTYLIVIVAFFLLTFALGGLLTAAYSFFGVAYQEGNGYLVEQAPVGLVIGTAGVFAAAVALGARGMYRYRKIKRGLVACTLLHGGKQVQWFGLSDSGNCLSFRGEPVCVISARGAYVILGRGAKPVGSMTIHTVNGANEAPVYLLENMRVGKKTFSGVHLVIGQVESKEYQLVLHTQFTEGAYEAVERTQGVVAKDKGKRKRHTLPLRK